MVKKIISCITIITFLATTAYAETAFCLRVPVGESASYQRISDLIQAYSNSGKIDFISRDALGVPEISLKRAWAHKYETWKNNKVFKVPLVYSDHVILNILSVLFIPFTAAIFSVFYKYSESPFLKFAFFGSILFCVAYGIRLIEPHLQEISDARGVVRNARKYIKNPDSVEIDYDLLRRINDFVEFTGWKVAFTDSPYVLAYPQLEKRRVIMSIGWVIASGEDRDRRRRAYLREELSIMRHSIENLNEIIGPRYRFAGFREAEGSTEDLKMYKGDVLIEGIKFALEIDIRKSAATGNLDYVYKLFYKEEQVAVAIRKNEGRIPGFDWVAVKEEYRSQKIAGVIPSLKGLSIGTVLMNVVFKDILLDSNVDFSKTVAKVVMGDKRPHPEIVRLNEKFKMVPLDKYLIISMMDDGAFVRLGGIEEGEQPYFYLYLRDEAGYDREVRMVLKLTGVDRAINDKKVYDEVYRSGKLMGIVEGNNDTYEVYIGGAWGLDQDKIDWLKTYLESLPSWQSAQSASNNYTFQQRRFSSSLLARAL